MLIDMYTDVMKEILDRLHSRDDKEVVIRLRLRTDLACHSWELTDETDQE